MTEAEYRIGRTFLVRLAHKSEIMGAITNFARKKDIKMATFNAVGALQRAKMAYYDQKDKEYRVIELQGPHEILNLVGNVSYHNKRPFAHAHVVLGDEQGTAKGGHLLEGVVFAAELHIQELEGNCLERAPDSTTGLALWKKPKS